jgi:hypothetical protein
VFSTFSQNKITIIDDETNTPVPYVRVQTLNQAFSADIDGVVALNVNRHLTYSFACMGYDNIEISGNDLFDMQSVRMKMLPVELNPIVISAAKALSLLEQYVINTSKIIPKVPFYINCYQNDKIFKGDELLLDAKGILVSEIFQKAKPSKGGFSITRVKGLSVQKATGYNTAECKELSYYPPFINSFFLHESRSSDKSLYFYISDSNDSVCIIGYKPNKEYVIKGKSVLTSGKFYIDKKTETIIRIDSEIEPNLLKKVQEIQQSDDKKNVIVDCFYRTIKFKNGLPVTLEEKFLYRSKGDKSNAVYSNIIVQKFELTNKSVYDSKPSQIEKKMSIAYQTPLESPNFESDFNQGFFKQIASVF